MEGATIIGAAPLSQERRTTQYGTTDVRQYDGSGDVFLETFMAGDEEVVLISSSDLRKLSGIPGVDGYRTYSGSAEDSELVGGPSYDEATGFAEVPEADFVSREYLSRKKEPIPSAPARMINPQAGPNGRASTNPRYESLEPGVKRRLDQQGITRSKYRDWLYSVNEENPEWISWFKKYAKNNPTHRKTEGSDGLATVVTPHINVGGGFHFIPGVSVDGKPVYFYDKTGSLEDKRSLGERVRRLKIPGSPGSYSHQVAEYDRSEVRSDRRPRLSGKDLADAYKQASTGSSRSPQEPQREPTETAQTTEATSQKGSSFELFELPVVDTPKGRRRIPQRLTDNETLMENMRQK